MRLNLYIRYIPISTEAIGFLGCETTPRPSEPAQLSSMVGNVSCTPSAARRSPPLGSVPATAFICQTTTDDDHRQLTARP